MAFTVWDADFGRSGRDDAMIYRRTGVLVRLESWLYGQAGQMFLWVPVFLSIGILIYFVSSYDGWEILPVLVASLSVCVWSLYQSRVLYRTMGLVFVLIGAGLLIAIWHGDRMVVDLDRQTYRPVELTGQIDRVSLRGGGAVRLVISDIHLPGLARPVRVRVNVAASLLPERSLDDLPGRSVTGLFRLRSPPRPVIPGARDFARDFWFWDIDATGFALRLLELGDRENGNSAGFRLQRRMMQWRLAIVDRIAGADNLSTAARGVILALITGERGSIPRDNLDQMRASGLAHLLAISGLHMALVAGGLYTGLRFAMALFPRIALRWPTARISAGLAMAGAAFYLGLSGAGVATERAFIMTSVGFLAVMVDRRALSMRTVALSAAIILAINPLALLSPGFQMSFAAVAALIGFYERIWMPVQCLVMERLGLERSGHPGRRFCMFLLGIATTSLVAGMATAPFAFYHFQSVAHFGVLANILAMPLMTLWVMPLAILSVLAMPLGLEGWPLQAMAWGVDGILAAAQWVSALPAAHSRLAAPPDVSLAFVSAAMVILLGVRGRLTIIGPVLIALAGMTVWIAPQPVLLVEEEGRTVAVYNAQQEQVHLSTPKLSRYDRNIWLQRLGEPEVVSEESGWTCDSQGCVYGYTNGDRIIHSRDPRALWEDCRRADVLILSYPLPAEIEKGGGCSGPDLVIDRYDLWRNGAYAIYDQVAWAGAVDHRIGQWLRTLIKPIFFMQATDRKVDRRPNGKGVAGTEAGLGEDRYVATHVRGERGHRLWSPDPLNSP